MQVSRAHIAFAVALCALASSAVDAHSRSRGKSRFAVQPDGRVDITLEFNDQDLLDLVDIDLSSEREAAEAKAGLMMGRLSTRVPRWLKVEGDGQACPLAITSWDHPTPRAIWITAQARCAAQPTELTIHWGVSKAADLDLMSVSLITAPGDIRHAVIFSRSRPKAHVVVKHPSWSTTFGQFLQSGVHHIVTGWDHLAFLLALVLACATLRRLLWVATGFTVAHSITLALGALDIVKVPGTVVEPIIALSIAVAAAVGIYRLARGTLSYPGSEGPQRNAWLELTLVGGFGLVHGLGFASMLQDALQGAGTIAVPLIAFNVGVELGQVVAVAVAFPVLVRVGRTQAGARVIGALLTGLVALGVWVTVVRVLEG
jgi:hypothetical protein